MLGLAAAERPRLFGRRRMLVESVGAGAALLVKTAGRLPARLAVLPKLLMAAPVCTKNSARAQTVELTGAGR